LQLSAFLEYACDPRYGWAAECEQRVGARPVQVCHEGNTAVHAAEYEGRPERRPLTRGELRKPARKPEPDPEPAQRPRPVRARVIPGPGAR
jgi:hypothetical protein